MKTIYILILTVVGLILFEPTSNAQKLDPKIASLFVYSFTKYIEWPQKDETKDFVIGVVGTSPIYNELVKVAAIKKVGRRDIVVKNIAATSVEELKAVQIIVIAESESSKIKSITESLKGSPVLIVSEKEGLAKKGAGISLYLDDEDEYKTKFEMNKAVVENQGLKVAPNLVALAVLVN